MIAWARGKSANEFSEGRKGAANLVVAYFLRGVLQPAKVRNIHCMHAERVLLRAHLESEGQRYAVAMLLSDCKGDHPARLPNGFRAPTHSRLAPRQAPPFGGSQHFYENSIHHAAASKKSWLFFGREEAGHTFATINNPTESGRILGIHPRDYLFGDMTRLPTMNNLASWLMSRWMREERVHPPAINYFVDGWRGLAGEEKRLDKKSARNSATRRLPSSFQCWKIRK